MKISGNIVDIIAKKIFPGTVFVEDGKITKITDEIFVDSISRTSYTETYLEKNLIPPVSKLPVIIPGIIDAHLHIEMTQLSPYEYARAAFSQGVIGALVDCHDTSAVTGLKGINLLIENSKKSEFYFGFSAPGTLHEGLYSYEDAESLLSRSEVTHLGEIKDFPAVVFGDGFARKLFFIAEKYNKVCDGHAPGLTGSNLMAYCKMPVSTDHEVHTLKECEEKINAGLKIQLPTRSAEFTDFKKIFEKHSDNLMLASELILGGNISGGYLNKSILKLIESGANIFSVFKAACLNPKKHYGLENGLVQVGDNADFVEIDSLEKFNVRKTFLKGRCVYDASDYSPAEVTTKYPLEKLNFMTAKKISEDDIKIAAENSVVHNSEVMVNIIDAMSDELSTVRMKSLLHVSDGIVNSSLEEDILKLTFVSRNNEFKPQNCFVHGFGMKNGAIATTISHENHDIICVGTNDGNIIAAVNRLIEIGGGIVYAADGKIAHEIYLPFEGLVSDYTYEELTKKYGETSYLVRKIMGVSHPHPLRTISNLANTDIPNIKISPKGLFNVATQEVIGNLIH